MKDLFSGSLGRLNNHGGSRIYTTPNTILIPPEYEIDIGEHGKFIACSLDGRLWLFEDKIIALKWDRNSKRMEFLDSRNVKDKFIARGIDWILTKNYFISAQNEEPYFYFHELEDNFKNKELPNIDFSLLPNMGDYQLAENLLIKKNEDGTRNFYLVSYLYGLQKISYETCLMSYNGQLWGCFLNRYFGKAVLIKKAVSSNNEVHEFYISIIPTYDVKPDDYSHDGIIEFLPAKTRLPKEFFFASPDYSSVLCKKLYYPIVYSISKGTPRKIADNQYSFFDVFSPRWFILDENIITLLDKNKSFNCRGLYQWVAPQNILK